jgi:poly [ADP-ribose] polymerase
MRRQAFCHRLLERPARSQGRASQWVSHLPVDQAGEKGAVNMDREPILRRKFVFADFRGNHNKEYTAELWADGTFRASWGRVGAALQTQVKAGMSRSFVEAKIQEKLDKGYREVELHRPSVVVVGSTVGVDPDVADLMKFVAVEAGHGIQTYSAVPVDALSQQQIRQGRDLLDAIRSSAPGWRWQRIEQYLNTVPTKVPFRRLEQRAVSEWFAQTLAERYDQLDQLEASLAVHNATLAGDHSVFAGLDVEITPLISGPACDQVTRYIEQTRSPGVRIRRLFSVTINPERAAWEAETAGKGFVRSLFHGTKSHNLQKILRAGLIIPVMAANGSRFGRGVYFADHARRSENYAGSTSRPWKAVLIADVALGRMRVLDGENPRLIAAPHGCDSVRGVKSFGGLDEFVVYRTGQQTIRALAVLE